MKKAIALALVLVTAVLFASCGEDGNQNNTTTSIIPVDSQVFQSSSSAPVSVKESQGESTGATMILTSKYGETMPTVVTTLFNPANEKTEITVPSSFVIPQMAPPSVNTSAITSAPTTTTATSHTEPTEPKTDSAEDNKTDTAGKTMKTLEYTSFGLSASNNVTLEFDAAGWNGGVKSGKFNAQVKTDDGKTSSVVGRVVGIQNSDGYFSVLIPVEDLITKEETSSINITIPAGSVTSRKDDQTSKTYTATIAVN